MYIFRNSYVVISTIIVAGLFAWWSMASPTIDELVVQTQEAIDQHDEKRVVRLTNRILELDATHPEGLLLSAVVAAELEDFEAAIAFCERVLPDDGEAFRDAQIMAGNISLERLGKVSQAEAHFREVLSSDPDNLVANERMVHVLSLQARSWELIPHQIRVLRQSSQSAPKVQLLMRGELAYPDESYVRQLRSSDPDCAGLALAKAHIEFLSKRYEEAKRSCRVAIKLQPDFPEAHARLGRILLQIGTNEELIKWYVALPASAWQHPQVLNTAGQLALRHRALHQAARSFWESLRIDPNSVSSNFQLGQCLIRLGRLPDAQVFLLRSASLEQYEKQLDSNAELNGSAHSDSPHSFNDFLLSALQAKETAESLGLVWEAYAWSLIAAQAPISPAWARPSLKALRERLSNIPLQRTDPEFNPALTIDLSEFPHPLSLETLSLTATEEASTDSAVSVRISFIDDASTAGLSFRYDNGMITPRVAQIRPYDFTGGGVAVIDANMDGCPDIFFTQGSRTLPGTSESPTADLRDRLYLNQQGQEYSDVTDFAIPFEADYSQGVSVGDFNNDGFADLLIANVGQNRLLQNNGDGTFADVSSAMNGAGDEWTTSCLICDLNQDGLPDLYFVNYLAGEALTRICSDDERRFGRCSPRDFSAAQDQILLNEGHGLFRDVTADSGIQIPKGKGLGVVAGDFNGDRKIDLFVANDGAPNFFFENVAESTSSDSQFKESAMVRGLAVNADGQPEACMGIVLEDLDQDGHLDLFVANFMDETNTLYRSLGNVAMFVDATNSLGLAVPSLRMLAFGAQSIDADLDGRPDLVVTNGHVDSYSEKQVPYRMPAQFFRNIDGLRFREVESKTLGEFFKGVHLGRSMARLDWNLDHAEDVVISHLDEPVALLTNTTSDRGHFLAVRLVGTVNARDAAGCVVTLKTPRMNIVRQLTMGDGYQASNERQLVFGLGAESTIDEVSFQWISGDTNTITDVAIGTCGLVVEGRNVLYSLPR